MLPGDQELYETIAERDYRKSLYESPLPHGALTSRFRALHHEPADSTTSPARPTIKWSRSPVRQKHGPAQNAGVSEALSLFRCEQLTFGRPAGDLGPRVEFQLLEDPGYVVSCCALGDGEFRGDLRFVRPWATRVATS